MSLISCLFLIKSLKVKNMQNNICLQAIANILLVNNQLVKEYGLLAGKMGVCLYLYEYARFIKSVEYTNYADDLLDEIINNITEVNRVDFSSGLPGIAFGINYLLTNKLVEGDSEEILGEIDNKIYQSLNECVNESQKIMPPIIISPIYFIYKGDICTKKSLLTLALKYVDKIFHSDTYLTPTCLNSIIFFLKNVKSHIIIPSSIMDHIEDTLGRVRSQVSGDQIKLTQSLYARMNNEAGGIVCDNINSLEFYTWQALLYDYKIKTHLRDVDLKEYIVNTSMNYDNEDLGFCKLAGLGLGILKQVYY